MDREGVEVGVEHQAMEMLTQGHVTRNLTAFLLF